MERATSYGLRTAGLALPSSIDLVEGGWSASVSGLVEDGVLRFVGEPESGAPALTFRFTTFESAGSAYEFMRLLGSIEHATPRFTGEPPPRARHEVEFLMEDRTDPVSAMRVATTVLYEAEGTRGYAVLKAAVARVRSEPVRADPTDGLDYREAFRGLVERGGVAAPATPFGRPRRRASRHDPVRVVSEIGVDCGVAHKLDEITTERDHGGVKGYVVIPTTDTARSGSARLRGAMVGMMRPTRRAPPRPA